MQVPFPIAQERGRWKYFQSGTHFSTLMPLRYSADWRSFFFLMALAVLFFVQWTGVFRHWFLLPITCVLAFVACIIKHNHIHCRTFSNRYWNRVLDHALGFCTGQSTAAIIPVHNER